MLHRVGRLKRIIKSLGEWHGKLITDREFDLNFQLNIISTQESLKFFQDNMPDALIFSTKNDFREHAISCISEPGLYLEFGVWQGNSVNYLGNKFKDKKIHGFDSFEGVPEPYNGLARYSFSTQGNIPKVRKNVLLHKGWFKDTIPNFLKNNDEKIAFLNIDCDIYSSTKTVFDLIGTRIQKGTIIIFDEFFNYHNWQDGEYKSFMEFVKEKNVKFSYLAVSNGTQVLVRIDEI